MFNKHSIFQNEQQSSKFTTRIRWLLTLFAFIITWYLINPHIVKADANDTHVNPNEDILVSGSGSSLDYDGAGAAKTGWLIYLVDAEQAVKYKSADSIGKIVSDVVYVHCGDTIPATMINFLYPSTS